MIAFMKSAEFTEDFTVCDNSFQKSPTDTIFMALELLDLSFSPSSL